MPTPPTKKQIGERVKKQRERLGLTQEELANGLGRHRKWVSDLERGRCPVNPEVLYLMKTIYGIRYDEILG